MQNLLIKIIISLLVILIVSPPVAADSIKGIDTVEYNLGILAKDPDNRDALKALAFHYLNLGNNGEARKYGERLLELGEKTGDRDFCEVYGKIVMGIMAIYGEEPSKAFSMLQEALSVAEATNNADALVSIYNSLGIYYLFIHNDPYTAISNYYSALDYAKQIDDRRRQDIISTNIAGCYLSRNDVSGLDIARDVHRSAIEQDELVPLYYASRHLILFYLLTDSIDKAEEMIAEVEDLSSKLDIDDNINLEKARLYEKKGDVKKAYRYYTESMEDFKNSDQSTVSATYLAYGRFLRNQKQLKAAINVLEYAVNNREHDGEGMAIHIPEIIQELALCYRDVGDNAKALKYSLIYQNHLDSAINLTRERTLQENRIKHDIFTRERKISEQQIELLANRNRMIILVTIPVVLIIVIVLMWVNYKKKDRIYSAIVSQNQDYIKREKMLHAQIDSQKEQLKQETTTQPQSSLHEYKINDLFTRFSTAMTEQKLYRDPTITVAAVADTLGTNRTYLSKAINESTGKTFTQIVNDYRIREAIELISNIEANIPLKQIAAEVGFNYIATFYVTFQSVVGMTPAKYRAKLKEI
ncbi:MAG: helix-turn-helix domain-containing protein [Muribaculaceae bacterium]|nr:helix-turn-helix domain-containing protein [Muribaculaceae bacterium]